jgi:hypothetical protein
MAELPQCPNFVRKRECNKSDIRLLGEQDDAWTLNCKTCGVIWVVSKPHSVHRAKYRKHEEQLRREAEARRAREKKAKIFA